MIAGRHLLTWLANTDDVLGICWRVDKSVFSRQIESVHGTAVSMNVVHPFRQCLQFDALHGQQVTHAGKSREYTRSVSFWNSPDELWHHPEPPHEAQRAQGH